MADEKENVEIKEGVDKEVESLIEKQGGSLVDLSEFDGMKAKISVVTQQMVDSLYDDFGNPLPVGQKRKIPKLLVMTEKLAEKQTANGKTFEVRGKHYFGLKLELKNNEYIATGWSDKGKLAAFLIKHKVKHPRELIGKNVICRDKAGFLDFYVE